MLAEGSSTEFMELGSDAAEKLYVVGELEL